MTTIELNLPSQFELSQQDLKVLLAKQLYGAGKLSITEAAELTGLPVAEFIDILMQLEISKPA